MKIKSIRTKIGLLIMFTSVLLLTAVLAVSYGVNKKNIVDLCESYLYDTCISASDTLYESFYGDSERNDMSVRLQYILYNVGIDTMDSSRGYLIDKDGTYLYHENSDMIGQKIEGNPVIEEVMTRMQEGYITTADVRECNINGKDVYVAFMCTVNDWIVFVQADASDVLRPVNSIAAVSISVGITLLVIALIISTLVARKITKPVLVLTNVINDISALDLQSEHKIPKTKDEVGTMVNAVMQMKGHLSTIVTELNDITEKLVNDSNVLYTISEKVNAASTDNSATNEELAASMEETSASTDSVNSNIMNMNGNVVTVADKINEGSVLTTDAMRKSGQIYAHTKEASDETIKVYESIKKTSNIAIEKAKEVQKINELATAIQDISDETTLLSLNASIEAARAGEAGRGFAVVASEIGKLAAESTETSANIMEIVSEVNASVETLTQCLVDVLQFLENKVMKDYSEFMASSEEYNSAARSIGEFMNIANEEVNALKLNIASITEAMGGIRDNVNESTLGVNDIANKTMNVVELTVETFDRTTNCRNSAEKLMEITSRFKV